MSLRPPSTAQRTALRCACWAVWCVAFLCLPAHAERLAVLPLEAPGLLSTTADEIDAAVRTALVARGVLVQPQHATTAMLDEAHAAGLTCQTLTEACARSVALVAEVDAVVRTEVIIVDDALLMRLTQVHVDEQVPADVVAGRIVLPNVDAGKSIDLLVGRVRGEAHDTSPLPFVVTTQPIDATLQVDGKSATGTLWLQPGEHQLDVTALGYAPLTTTIFVDGRGLNNSAAVVLVKLDAQTSPLRYVGLSLVGTGAVLAIGGGAFAGASEAALYVPWTPAQRQQVQGIGIVGLLVTAVGAATLAAGGLVAFFAGDEVERS